MAATSSVSVALRIKPAAADDKSENGCLDVTESADGQKALVTVKSKAGALSEFAFDTVFMDARNTCQAHSLSSAVLPNTQRDVFERVAEPLCRAVLQGMHASILAYGQTGSGKTYTMLGPLDSDRQRDPDQHGLLPRCLNYLFEHLPQPAAPADKKQSEEQLKRAEQQEGQEDEEYRKNDGDENEAEVLSWKMEVQFVEIYQERIFDLLGVPTSNHCSLQQQTQGSGGAASGSNGGNNNTSAGLAVRYDKHGKGAYVAGAVRKEVFCLEDALEAFRAGLRVRRTSETKLNSSSSRSHAIFSVFLTQTKTEPAVGEDIKSIVTAQLHLVDLAGSERQKDTQAVGERLREAGKINSSLSILSQVVRELAEGGGSGGHVPYRDSKLTFLLMSSLGGSGKAAVIATLNQQQQHAMETRSTLSFAALSKSVRLRPVTNQVLTLSNGALQLGVMAGLLWLIERVLALIRERAQMAAELRRLQALVGSKEELMNEETTSSPSPTAPACSADLFQALIDATEAAEVAKTQLRAVLRRESGQYSGQAGSKESGVAADKSAHEDDEDGKQQHHLLQLLLRHSMYSPQLLLQLQEAGIEKDTEGGVSTFLRSQAVLVRLLELQRHSDLSPHGAVAAEPSACKGAVTSAAVADAVASAFERAVPLLKSSNFISSEQRNSREDAANTKKDIAEEQKPHQGEDTGSCYDIFKANSGILRKEDSIGDADEENVNHTDQCGLFRSLWEPQMLAAAELLGSLAEAALLNDSARDREGSGAREEESSLMCFHAIDEALQRLAGLRGFKTVAKEENIEQACSELQESDASVDRSSADTDSRSSTLASRGISSTDAVEETAFFPLSPRGAAAADSSLSLNSNGTAPTVSDEHSVAAVACTARPQAATGELLEANDASGLASDVRDDLDYEQLRDMLIKERSRNRALEERLAELELQRQNYMNSRQPKDASFSQEKGEEQRVIGLPFVLPLSAICDGQNVHRGQLTFCVHSRPGEPLAQNDPSCNGPCYISIWEDCGEAAKAKPTLLLDSVPFTLLKKVSRVRESTKAKGFCAGSLAEHTAKPSEKQSAEGSQLDEQSASKASTFPTSTHFLYRLYFRQPIAISLKGQGTTSSDTPSSISWVTVAIQGGMIGRWNIRSTEDCDKLILQAMRRGAGKHHHDSSNVRGPLLYKPLIIKCSQ
ncbi:hypothetical protein Emed_000375 [Eimeria media]